MDIMKTAEIASGRLRLASQPKDGFLIMATDGKDMYAQAHCHLPLLAIMMLTFLEENPQVKELVKQKI